MKLQDMFSMQVNDLGLIRFSDAFALQERLVAEVYSDTSPETLLLLEHFPVYTIGRTGKLDNVLDPAVETVRINRGGDITYHAPGQLVGYPILNLGKRRRDLRHYLRFLEEVLIQVAADFGVSSYRVDGETGVWTDQGKLASIGAGARRWVTMHGFALNVSLDLAGFERINPCGIVGCTMTSLQAIVGRPVAMAEVKERTVVHFECLLDQWLPAAADGNKC
jgi:lipoyl(octanoyl) transferase